MRLSRRHFLRSSGVVALAFAGLQKFSENSLLARGAHNSEPKAKDPLVADYNQILDLPPGFSYQLISEVGEKMDDGLVVPGRHDGMCAFPGQGGKTILIRNHEVETSMVEIGPFGSKHFRLRRVDQAKLYDLGKGKKPGLGGTTTLVYDTKLGRLERHFLSLAGTYRNCAGGPTPWNSWISCEETVEVAGDDIEKDHGYNFEVPVSDKIGLIDPIPLKAMGRFRHEAVAVDPGTGIVYQTEDRPDGLFYRFIPNTPGKLVAGGRLQVLRVRSARGLDTRNWRKQTISIGQSVEVEWVDVEDVESPDDDLRYQGRFERGAARFARAEGIWYARNSFYFACTLGGKKKKGQIWRYLPGPNEGTSDESKQPGRLELFIEPNDGTLIENADNLTMAPWGDLIVCEDGASPQFLVGVTPAGKLYKFAKTTLSEFAGVTFSPDGTTLFVNIQVPGLTLAIKGPWQKLQALAMES